LTPACLYTNRRAGVKHAAKRVYRGSRRVVIKQSYDALREAERN
jgi:hypothetical protein